MLSEHPGVDVVVVSYRTPDDLFGFVEAFQEVQWDVPCSLHIANVDPLPDDIAACQRISDELDIQVPVTYSEMKTNVGYAKTCNAIAARLKLMDSARATIAFFNADTRLRPGVLDACHWELHKHPKLAVIGPKQVNSKGEITSAGVFGTNQAPKLRGWKQQDKGQFDDFRIDAVSVSGSAYFVKRLAWDELWSCPTYQNSVIAETGEAAEGAFLPTQHYFEEMLASVHARSHGWQVGFIGRGVCMQHEWHQASEIGGSMDKQMPVARALYRKVCDAHGIPRE